MTVIKENKTKARTDNALEILDKTINHIEENAAYYEKAAKRNKLLFNLARFITGVLGVATPVLVTYQTQQSDNPYLIYFTIIVTSLTGAAATLQASFRWGSGFARSIMTSLSLKELLALTKLKVFEIRDSTDTVGAYGDAKRLNETALTAMQNIIRNQIEGEVSSIITQDKEELSPDNNSEGRQLK